MAYLLPLCLIWDGIYLNFISNQVLIRFDQLKLLNAVNLLALLKPLHSYFPHTFWVRQVLTLAINNVSQKEEATLEFAEDVAEF
jgi:hypothetical protein